MKKSLGTTGGAIAASLVLLAGALPPLAPSALAYTKAEREAAVAAVEKACADAQIAANGLEESLKAVKAQLGEMEKLDETARNLAAEAKELKETVDALPAKVKDGTIGKFELDDRKGELEGIGKRLDEATGSFAAVKDAYTKARDAFGVQEKASGRATYLENVSAARQASWIKSEKCKEAAEIYRERMEPLQDAVAKLIADFEESRGKAEDKIVSIGAAVAETAATQGASAGILAGLAPKPEVVTQAPQIVELEKTYTIQFLNPDGTEIPGFTYTFKSTENKPPVKPPRNPEREWYKFLFWSEDKTGNAGEYNGWGVDKFGEGALRDKTSMSLFAIWEEIPVQFVFYGDVFADGDTPAPVLKEYKLYRSQRAIMPNPLPEDKNPRRWGHEFGGWAERLPGGGLAEQKYAFGTILTNDVALCPVWVERPMPVNRFDFGPDGLAAFGEPLQLRLSDAFPADLPAADGYAYTGWGIATNAPGQGVSAAVLQPIAKDARLRDHLHEPLAELNLYAIRKPVPHKAIFRTPEGHTVAEVAGSVEQAAMPPETPEVQGRRFVGWFENNAEKPYEARPITSDITLVARYEAIPFFATFMVGPETNAVVEYSVDNPFALPKDVPVRDGWTFTGWSCAPDNLVAPDFEALVATNVTFYAMGKLAEIEYEFYSQSVLISKGKIEYGSRLTPPKIVEANTGSPLVPRGWGPRSNARPRDFFDFGKPVRTDPRTVLKLCAVWPEELWDQKIPIMEAGQWEAVSAAAERK